VHFIVMGCGRVGAAAARALEDRGHSVAVIDQNPQAFRRLGEDFEGQRVTGVGFDRDVLTQADVQNAYGFAAVSSGDNSNILAARVVRETFGVQNVVARIYDPERASVYERLGIQTVATVPWAAEQILHAVLPAGALGAYSDPTGRISLARFDLHAGWVGTPLSEIEAKAGGRVAFLHRFGEALMPPPEGLYQAGDRLYMVLPTDDIDTCARLLARAPEEEG
jgi:trk system potassium uptake protein TrkA